MGILGNYVVFFISMMGMTLAVNGKYQQFYQEMLELHNKYRKMHGASKLIMDAELSKNAMKIAKYVDEKPNPEFSVDIGNNFFFEYLYTEPNAKVVFDSWYSQGNNYTYNDDPIMLLETSAFTQIVWKSTKQLGVAVYPGKNNLIIIATYFPPGNDLDDYPKNVVAINDRKDDSSSSWGIKKQRTG